MKDRIMEIMKLEGMTQQEFAAALDISPASLSNIFNGKTNPTNNHVNAIHKRFPNINISWLMFGEGNMYMEGSADSKNKDSLSADELSGISFNSADRVPKANYSSEIAAGVIPGILNEQTKIIDRPQRKIVEIRIFFDDGTFETFSR
ncbi:MAG: helix-turn-helix domain-containing protein [Candidatus Paraprevotella stercoravium]|uniref:Helix-turn-helix domain-containing protein n=1 Tax=Candidatus Paraprevotella stercoravium TaxID=2838725 RepID=A0A9E2L810_9BACT|nr:helix-turn-helix domain-containing protein [Candidatus Paraprevotella stercoravium]